MNERTEIGYAPRSLLREASQSFFQSLHEIIGANTFFVTEDNGQGNRVISVFNAKETVLREGAPLSTCMMGEFRDWQILCIPIYLGDGRKFGMLGALDRRHLFTQADANWLEKLASSSTGVPITRCVPRSACRRNRGGIRIRMSK